MKVIDKHIWVTLAVLVSICGASMAQADTYLPVDSLGSSQVSSNTYPDTIGLKALQAITTNLNGSGIRVGQAEASAPAFEVNPANVGQPSSLFTYYYNSNNPVGTPYIANGYPNVLGSDYTHADNVGGDFYGTFFGVATNVAHVDNFDAQTFAYNYVNNDVNAGDQVVNQSYTFGVYYTSVDQWFDNYAALYGVLFVSGAGTTGSAVCSPATCYNGIAVGVYNNASSPYGPTAEGRSKPDLTAWGNQDTVTSYSTPLVAGAAAILWQAGARGDGGSNTNSATDIRTIKALLLNGAVKPIGWTNSPAAPLHTFYGAGLVNVLNSYEQLAGGQHGYVAANTEALGAAHLPPTYSGGSGSEAVVSLTGTVGASKQTKGWDFDTISSSSSVDAVNHYYFQISSNLALPTCTATATLVWNRQYNQSSINNLGLFLYNAMSGQLVACSTSMVDNVQHVYIPQLTAGTYDLQVWKAGGSSMVSSTETYALAYQFFGQTISAVPFGTNIVVSWPVYPSGFLVQASTNYVLGNWQNLTNSTPTIVGNHYQMTVPAFDPNAIYIIDATNSGAGSGIGIAPGGGSDTNTIIPVYNNFMDLHYFRLYSPNL